MSIFFTIKRRRQFLYSFLIQLSCFFIMTALFSPLPAHAEESTGEYTIENGVLTVRDGVQTIDYDTISEKDLYYVQKIILPGSLRHIGGAFYAAGRITEVNIPEGVETMSSEVFSYCASLRMVTLPSTLREFNALVFDDCFALRQVNVSPENPYFMSVDGVVFTKDGSMLVYYPQGRPDAHYDVPAGTTAIARAAFMGNDFLQSISLPLGLTAIDEYAFARCGMLHSAALPLTLSTIGNCAFINCVHLTSIAVPKNTAVGEKIFINCPLLEGYDEWKGESNPRAYDDTYKPPSLYGVLNPENARDLVTVLQKPDKSAEVVGRYASGSGMEVFEQEGDFYRVIFSSQEVTETGMGGYVKADEIMLTTPLQGWFIPVRATVRDNSAGVYWDPYVLPYDLPPNKTIEKDTEIIIYKQLGQWCRIGFPDEENNICYCYVYISDLSLIREYTGDNKTFGIVVNSDPHDRLHLRAEPKKSAKSLGKFFSGTQVEILSEADGWYQVCAGFQEGYMMKEFVDIVPQESIGDQQ